MCWSHMGSGRTKQGNLYPVSLVHLNISYFVIGRGKNIPVCEKIEMPASWSSKVLNYLIMHISFSISPCILFHCLCL